MALVDWPVTPASLEELVHPSEEIKLMSHIALSQDTIKSFQLRRKNITTGTTTRQLVIDLDPAEGKCSIGPIKRPGRPP